ncbi:MAG: aminoglycoside phosphotransferase family protein [Methanohalobium sp.]|uniref:aminoglycoside phosphotransferase family protein n=1 Tax=Methanohalobium sp. TaxID=2837493 RepID=UPI0039799B30
MKTESVFRGWLIHELGDKINHKNCEVDVFEIVPASHTVCRYKFRGEKYSVVGKFFAEPKGKIKKYDYQKAMMNEFKKLEKIKDVVNISRPIAVNKHFNCVMITEYISGKPLSWYFEHDQFVKKHLSEVSKLLRKLHENKQNYYNKKRDFADFHQVLNNLHLGHSKRDDFNRLLGEWWYSSRIEQKHGSMIHQDATLVNYIFSHGKPHAIDFESSLYNANYIRDLGVLCAEIKNHHALRGDDKKAEPYIRHFLKSYSKDEGELYRIESTLPFFMSYGLLREARICHDYGHRDYLIREAINYLKF